MRLLRKHAVLFLEAGLFLVVLTIIALDEFADLPHLYLGAPKTPYRVEEYLLESGSILVAAVAVIVTTALLQRRMRQEEEFLRVCGWCRKVHDEGRWITFEEYLAKTNGLQSTHGICEECRESLLDEMMRKSL